MKMRRIIISLIGLFIATAGTKSTSHDVDLFTLAPNAIDPPNILFLLDNSANWNATLGSSTKREMIHEALYKFLDGIKPDVASQPFNLGLMAFADGNSPRGGRVVKAFTLLDSEADVEALQYLLYCNPDSYSGGSKEADIQDCEANLGTDWAELLDSSIFTETEYIESTNNAPYALLMNEARLYFAGQTPRSGTQDGPQAWNHTESPRLDGGLVGYDPAAISSGVYLTPITEDNYCSSNYSILVGNGAPDSGENNDAETVLTNLGGMDDSYPFPLSPNNHESNWADEFAFFMANNDFNAGIEGSQTAATYVLDIYDTSANLNKPAEAARAFLKNIANKGNGQYYAADNVDDIVGQLQAAFDEIMAVNSVFASVSLPVSVNVRGTSLNQVYMGVFRPVEAARWYGNLKVYKIGFNPETNNVELQDADGNPAEDADSGFVRLGARSFWTADSNYWTFTTTSDGRQQDSDSPDGKEVERGGVAQGLRERTTGRNMLTCAEPCDTGSTLTNFSDGNTNITAAQLGAADAAERSNIINFIRGTDVLDDEPADSDSSAVRAWIHGDVLHSEPIVINYGSTDGIYVFYGANDGTFRAIDGGVDESIGSTDGEEVWAFVAPEFYPKLKDLYDNDALTGGNFDGKPYFFDGLAGSYIEYSADFSSVDKAYLYITVRRGGNFMYALDVTDPESPSILWKIDASQTGYGELGETWSRPIITTMAAHDDPVLIMGLGYDPAADDVAPQTVASQGRGVMVLDAFTGDPIWQVGPNPSGAATNLTMDNMIYPIPAQIAAVDRDRDGNADRFYFGDTGGQLWRADVASATPSDWKVTRLLTTRTGTAPLDTQKFLFPPDVVEAPSGEYDAVIIGTGDRENPLLKTNQDFFIVYKDEDQAVGISSLYDNDGTPDDSNSRTLADLLEVSESTDLDNLTDEQKLLLENGWYLGFEPGEKASGAVTTVNQFSLFNTHEPASASGCQALGTARRYTLNPFLEEGIFDGDLDGEIEVLPGGGFIPDATTAIIDVDGNGELIDVFCTGPDCEAAPNSQLLKRFPIYKYNEQDAQSP